MTTNSRTRLDRRFSSAKAGSPSSKSSETVQRRRKNQNGCEPYVASNYLRGLIQKELNMVATTSGPTGRSPAV